MRRTAEPAAAAVAPRQGPGRPVSLAKRNAMLNAAIVEFMAAGVDGASMDAIAARAAVSKRSLYNHFDSKLGLFHALVAEVAQRIELYTRIEYAAERPLREQLMQFALGSLRLHESAANVQLLRAVVAEHIRHPQHVEPLLRRFSANEYGLTSWMQAACRDGRLHGEPARLSRVMGSFMRADLLWPAILGRAAPRRAALQRDMAESIDMFLLYFGQERTAQAEAARSSSGTRPARGRGSRTGPQARGGVTR